MKYQHSPILFSGDLEENISQFKRRIYSFTVNRLYDRMRKPFRNSNRLKLCLEVEHICGLG